MKCENCGSEDSLHMDYLYDEDIEFEHWWCDKCGWDEDRNHKVIE